MTADIIPSAFTVPHPSFSQNVSKVTDAHPHPRPLSRRERGVLPPLPAGERAGVRGENRQRNRCVLIICLTLLLTACAPLRSPSPTQPALVTVSITADGKTQTAVVPINLTVREALAQAGLTLGDLDRLTPPAYTTVSE